MPLKNPIARKYLTTRVDAVKAKLAAKIDTYIELHELAARNAAAKGNSAPIEWMLSHAEVQERDGTFARPIAASIDRPSGDSKNPTGPTINIGFLGAAQPASVMVSNRTQQDQLSADPSTLLPIIQAGPFVPGEGTS